MAFQTEQLSRETLTQMFCELYKSRKIQEAIKKVGGRVILDTGEEAISIGSVFGLDDTDFLSCYFRGDASNLRIRGAYSLRDLLAGWLYRKGENNPATFAYPASWIDVDHGVIGTTSSLIGADTVICAGAALAQNIQGTGKVVLFLSGDGATSKGEFYETMNFAKLNKLPLIILIRNNNYAMSTTMDRNIAIHDFTDLPNTFGIPSVKIDGNDLIEVQKTVAAVAAIVRKEGGPYVIIAKTFRMAPHTIDDEDEYRNDIDRTYWIEHDPINVMEQRMIEEYGFTQDGITALKNNCQEEVTEALKWVMSREPICAEDVVEAQRKVVAKMWGGKQ